MKKLFALLLVFAMLLMPITVFAEDEENFILSEEILEIGSKDYALNGEYEYTVFIL